MIGNSMDISIVVVNWKVRDLLRDCLRSIYDTTHLYTFEITVVDNDSQDGSVEMLRVDFPDVNIIPNTENVGHSRAMNQAIPLSRGRYVVLLNPDVVLLNGTLDEMARFLDEHPKTGAVGGKELRPDGTFAFRCRRRLLSPWMEMLDLFGGKRLRLHPWWGRLFRDEWMRDVPAEQLCRVEILATACMMVRQEVFETVGLLDETFWLMSEDVDISIRMGRAGWEIYYLPHAVFYHHHGQSIKQSEKNMRLIVIGERYVLMRKFWGQPMAFAWRLAVFFSAWAHLLAAGALMFRDVGRAKERLSVARELLLWSLAPVVTPR